MVYKNCHKSTKYSQFCFTFLLLIYEKIPLFLKIYDWKKIEINCKRKGIELKRIFPVWIDLKFDTGARFHRVPFVTHLPNIEYMSSL